MRRRCCNFGAPAYLLVVFFAFTSIGFTQNQPSGGATKASRLVSLRQSAPGANVTSASRSVGGYRQTLTASDVRAAPGSDTTPSFGGFHAAPFLEGSESNVLFIQTLTGDFNGDGKPDIAMISEEG